MKMLIEFDIDADIVDVPEYIVDNRELLRKRFLKWIYNSDVKHKYWVMARDATGRKYAALQYRSDAFVEWLNKKVLSKTDPEAKVIMHHVDIDDYQLPSIYF